MLVGVKLRMDCSDTGTAITHAVIDFLIAEKLKSKATCLEGKVIWYMEPPNKGYTLIAGLLFYVDRVHGFSLRLPFVSIVPY